MRPITDLARRVEPFRVISDYVPAGDQPAAIAELTKRIGKGEQDIVLLGATGTGKSATTAWLIEQLQRPTLVIAPNKTLAAQLANEFKELLPNNAVEYQKLMFLRQIHLLRRTHQLMMKLKGCDTQQLTLY